MEVESLGIKVDGSDSIDRAAKSLDNLSKSAKKSEETIDRFGQRYVKTLTGFDAMASRAAKEAQALGREIQKLSSYDIRNNDIQAYGAELDRLRAKYNPIFAASKAYEQALDELNRAHKVGAINAIEHANALQTLNARYQAATVSANQVKAAGQGMSGSFSGLAAQFQDIGVTAAMGMNPIMIALQQGTQIAGQMEMALMGGQSAVTVLGDAFKSLLGPIAMASIGLTAISAALLQAVDWSKVAKFTLDSLATAIDHVGEYAIYGAAGLAVLYAPSILAGLAAVSKGIIAMGVSMAKTAAIFLISNPVLLFGSALAGTVTLLHKFSKEVEQTIGIDVIGHVRKAANFILNSFVAAYEDIKFVWKNFTPVIGTAIIGAANIAIRQLNEMTQAATDSLNGLIRLANKVPGVNIAESEGVSVPEIENPFSKMLEPKVADRNKRLAEIMGRDTIGAFVKGAQNASKSASEWLRSIRFGEEEVKKARKKSEEQDEGKLYLDRLRERVALIGKETEYEQLLAKIRVGSMTFKTEQDKEQALALAQVFDQTTKVVDARKQLENIMASSGSAVDVATEKLRNQVQVLRDANVSSEQYAASLDKISQGTVTDAPQVTGLNSIVGGASSEMLRIATESQKISDWYTQQLEMQQSFLNQKLINEQTYAARVTEINEQNNDRMRTLQIAYTSASLSSFATMTGGVTDMLRNMGQEGTMVYKLMFAASKAASMAAAIVSTEEASTKALAIDPTGSLSSFVRAAGYLSVATMAAQTVMGMAHDGIDSVPKEGTWLLQKGERVTTAETSAKLDRTLDSIMSSQRPQSSANNVNITINADGSRETSGDSSMFAQMAQEIQNLVESKIKEREAKAYKQGGIAWQANQGAFS